jgi:hypothetical protein
MILSRISEYDFGPLGNNASVIGSCDPNPCFNNMPIHVDIAIDSYWVGGDSSGNGAVKVNFAPGVYTIVAGDEWGALAFEYFVVS